MTKNDLVKFYPPLEEKLNIISHAAGIILGLVALIFLVRHAVFDGNAWHIVSFSIFGASLVLLFTASTLYHSMKSPKKRRAMRIVDHASIYVLIAGTYTPFALVTLNGLIGWVVFGVSWGMAAVGITLKLFFTGRYRIISTLMYVLMGWMIVFFIRPLVAHLPIEGIYWLIAGGVAYTVGAVLYAIKRLKFNHAIFHVLVLIGSALHFVTIYVYVLP